MQGRSSFDGCSRAPCCAYRSREDPRVGLPASGLAVVADKAGTQKRDVRLRVGASGRPHAARPTGDHRVDEKRRSRALAFVDGNDSRPERTRTPGSGRCAPCVAQRLARDPAHRSRDECSTLVVPLRPGAQELPVRILPPSLMGLRRAAQGRTRAPARLNRRRKGHGRHDSEKGAEDTQSENDAGSAHDLIVGTPPPPADPPFERDAIAQPQDSRR